MAEYRWKRGDGDFAVRVDLESIEGVFQKGVVVEPGCKAILIVDGAHVDTLPAGEYNEAGIVARLKNFDLTRFATAILVDVGDVELRFTVPGLMTQDPMLIDVDVTLVLQVDEPLLFYTNVMKGRTSLTREELEQRFGVEIQNALQEAIGRRTVEDLNTDLSLKQQFEIGVDEHLRRTFTRTGFGFFQFRTVTYRYRGFDKIRGLREDFYLQVTEAEAKLAGRKRLFDVFDRNELQTIFEETRKLERDVMRQRERNRISREMSPLRVEEEKSTEEMARFLQEVQKGKLLRDQELRDYARTLTENEDDALSARKFLLRRVDLQREIEYELMRLVGRADIERQVAEAQGKARLAELDAAIAVDRARRLHDREEDMKNVIHVLEKQDKTAQGAQRIRTLQIELYERMKLTKLAVRDKGERDRIARKLWYATEKLELELRRQRGQLDLERERIEALSKASLEAILVTADEKQARIIAGLKKQEMLKDMSEEQIRWWAATKNPQLVTALEKMFEGTSKQEIEFMYQQWMADKDKAHSELADFANKAADRQQSMFDKGMETQRDTAVAAAGANRPTVVTGAGFGATVVGGGVGEGIFRCTRCGTALSPDAKFCHRCTQPVAGAPTPPSEGKT